MVGQRAQPQVAPNGRRGRCYPRVSIEEQELRILNSLAAFTSLGDPEPPELLVTRPPESRVTVRFWCPYCKRDHTHGRHGACPPGSCSCPLHEDHHRLRAVCTCAPGSANGHRVSHCNPRSPLSVSGYTLVEADQ